MVNWIRRARYAGSTAHAGGPTLSMLLSVSLVVALVLAPSVVHAQQLSAPVAVSDGVTRQQLELLAPSAATSDRFGYAIATDGDTAVIGAPGYDRNRGAVYVSTFIDGAWTTPRIVATGVATGDQFGCAVDIDGDTIVAGAWTAAALRGEVYVIERRQDGSWGPRTFIARGDVGSEYFSPDERLGTAVAIEGDRIFMSAPWAEQSVGNPATINAGAIYRCTRNADGTWGAATRVFAGSHSGVHLGMSIALQGDTLVCGNPGDGSGGINVGSVRVYEHVGTAWVESRMYRGVMHSQLGTSVDISGNTVMFGGRFYGGGGRVFAIERTGSTWTATPVEVAAGTGDDQIGYSVDIEGDRAVVGAMKADKTGVLNVGGIKVLSRHNGVWTSSVMVPMGDVADDAYGFAVALGRGKALVGGPAANTAAGVDTGAVRVFDGIAYSTAEDAALQIGGEFGLLCNDYGAKAATLTPSLEATDALHGSMELRSDGAFTYTPEKDFNGVATATYRVSDGTTESAPATITIVVSPVNDAPVALDDTATAQWRRTLSAPSVLANDTDADGDILVASIESMPSHGALSMASDGSYTYVAQVGFIGTDAFTYRVTDPSGAYDIATVSIAVTRPEDSAPVARSDEMTIAEDGSVGFNVLENDTKDEAVVGSLEATGFSEPAHGTLKAAPSGEITYTPAADWSGTDTFTYRAFDGGMYSTPATVTITVTPVNDRPIAAGDAAHTRRNQPVTISVLANDTDIDTPSLVIGDHSPAEHGTVVSASSTSLTYRPARDFVGTDTFTYRAFDGELYSEPATVTVTVNNANHAPVLRPATPEIAAAATGTHAVPAAGVSVASVLGASVTDADCDDVGMAVYAMKLRSGVWQYSLDDGATWADMVNASTDGALLLRPTDKLRFASYFNTGSTSLAYRAWDGRSGSAGDRVAIQATGGDTSFSTATDTASLDIDLPWDDKVGRLWGRDRYGTSVATARYASHDWTDLTHIVLVSGADENASDPLAAAGLVWAFRGAPMIQTSPKTLPTALEAALHEIADNNDTVRIHVVGGTNAIPEARITEIKAVLQSRGVEVSHDRIAGANRYDTAAKVADKMVELRGSEMSGDVLVAHGAERTRFFDALALSPIAATQGAPILLTAPSALSAETSAAIGALAPERVIVAGGTAVVSQAAFDAIPAATKVRWAGTSRFDTAIVISNNAIAEGMLSPRTVSVCSARPDASSLPDALASTSVSSGDASPLLLTQTAQTPDVTARWLVANKATIRRVWLVGGTSVITYDQEARIGGLVK